MYDELIKDLRESAPKALAEADFDFVEGWLKEAADAIEELQKRVPKTPHGRLIDADALAGVLRGFIAMYDSCPFSQLAPTDKARRDELQTALAEVINAPTIIEAEEGE